MFLDEIGAGFSVNKAGKNQFQGLCLNLNFKLMETVSVFFK